MDTTTRHTRIIAAPANEVYRLIDDVTRWPAILEPPVHVEHLDRTEHDERFHIWVMRDGRLQSWVSHRTLHPAAHRITFRPEKSIPPFTAMSGEWSLNPIDDGRTEIVIDHTYSLADDTGEDTVAAVHAAMDRGSTRELAAFAQIAELGYPIDELIDTFTDTVALDCALTDVYDFLYRADLWPERLPNVTRVELTEDEPGVQHMEVDTILADGTAHTTRSVRLCSTNTSIAYKQLLTPGILLGRSSIWRFTQLDTGVEVSATQTVVIDPDAARAVFGDENTLTLARQHVREDLGEKVHKTLAHATEYVQAQTRLD